MNLLKEKSKKYLLRTLICLIRFVILIALIRLILGNTSITGQDVMPVLLVVRDANVRMAILIYIFLFI
jgi:hypothetical protein